MFNLSPFRCHITDIQFHLVLNQMIIRNKEELRTRSFDV